MGQCELAITPDLWTHVAQLKASDQIATQHHLSPHTITNLSIQKKLMKKDSASTSTFQRPNSRLSKFRKWTKNKNPSAGTDRLVGCGCMCVRLANYVIIWLYINTNVSPYRPTKWTLCIRNMKYKMACLLRPKKNHVVCSRILVNESEAYQIYSSGSVRYGICA